MATLQKKARETVVKTTSESAAAAGFTRLSSGGRPFMAGRIGAARTQRGSERGHSDFALTWRRGRLFFPPHSTIPVRLHRAAHCWAGPGGRVMPDSVTTIHTLREA